MKTRHIAHSFIAAFGSYALLFAAAEAKPGKDKGNAKGGPAHVEKGKKVAKGGPAHAEKNKNAKGPKIDRFKDDERDVIVRYFSGGEGNGLPPGLAKNVRAGKPLPPGWQKKLTPGYRIQDDWWPSFSPVPYDHFPNVRRAPNTRLYWHGDRVVRVYEPTREVLDVITVPVRR